MERPRWWWLFGAPAALLLAVRFEIGSSRATPEPAPRAAVATTSDPQRPAVAARSARDLPVRAASSTEAEWDRTPGRDDRDHDAWNLPASDPRRELVEAFRAMSEDTSPAAAEQLYTDALDRGGRSSAAWTAEARAVAATWFEGAQTTVACYAAGCAVSLTAGDAEAFAAARQRIAEPAQRAPWRGATITSPAVHEPNGVRAMWILLNPEPITLKKATEP